MDLIEANLKGKEGTLIFSTHEKEQFVEKEFMELMNFIKTLNHNISKSERPNKSNQVWKLCLIIQRQLTYHYNPSDHGEIDNLTDLGISSISNIIEYVADCFATGKKMELALSPITDW